MENNIIVLEPYGGLCNRLWSLNAAYWLAERTGHDLVIVWNIAYELYAGFDDILINKGNMRITEDYLVPVRSLKTLMFRVGRNRKVNDLKKQCDTVVNDPQWREDSPEDLYDRVSGKSIYIRACNKFYVDPEHENDYGFIEFNKAILDEADKMINRVKDARLIGIHIRRTDNTEAIEKSKDAAFYRLADQEIADNENAMFYLATDDEKTEKCFKTRYGDRMITFQDKEYSRQSRDGIKHACIDLICLSKTSKIIGSAHSSFSLVAGELNKVPVVIAQ